MKAYFIRRFLLVIPTLLGITLLVFTVSRFAPGGPYERALQAAAAGGDGAEKSSADGKSDNLTTEQKEALEEQFGLDKPLMEAYLQWLGVLPKESLITKREYGGGGLGGDLDPETQVEMVLKGSDRLARVDMKKSADGGSAQLVDFRYLDGDGGDPREDGWSVRMESPADRRERTARRDKVEPEEVTEVYGFRAVAYKERFAGLAQGDLGRSFIYGESVWSLILQRIPIALYFGILSTIIIYGTCIPLGIFKAIKHRSLFDNLSSVLIFIGYSIPGYALGAVLVVFLGARFGWFPIFGLTSEGFDEMGTWAQLKDIADHTVLPLICYVVSGFAFLTMMMKNNLMDNLSADYVRTAMSKGVSYRKAVIGHAFRNSFIPIATGLGQLITLFVGGSMLIEKVFDIQGFGLLQFQGVSGGDTTLVMGTLTISALLMLIGNILSDVIVAMVDPRIKFN